MSVYYRDEHVTLHGGDCLDVLAELLDNSVDSVVTDPPYGLEFMGKDWDRPWAVSPTNSTGYTGRGDFTLPAHRDNRNANCRACGGRQRGAKRCECVAPRWDRDPAMDMRQFQSWCQQWATECLRVLKPGGHMLAFGGTRTHHRLASAIEDAGFEIRDSIAWLYGSGFPKSLDVSKAIDKAAGVEREVVGSQRITGCSPDRENFGANDRSSGQGMGFRAGDITLTAPATDGAQKWQGWGTALKPAFEPIVVARKPLCGTVSANVLAHGTGALNIDANRVEATGRPLIKSASDASTGIYGGGLNGSSFAGTTDQGRWPANVVLDGDIAGELDRQSGVLTSGANPTRRSSDKFRTAYGEFSGQQECVAHRGAESGGASRFFPVFRYTAKAATTERPSADGVSHPTVKPLELMRWLVRLVTPPHGIVLDPFAGSGTTGEAAIHEHMRAILIERERTYLPLIVARLSKPMEVGFDFDPVGEHIAQTMFTPGGTAAYEPIPLFDGEAHA